MEHLVSTALGKYPHAALRFSWVSGINWQLQMLSPAKVVNNGVLELRAKCFESKDELKEFSDAVIDWDGKEEWPIRGVRGPPDILPVPRRDSGSGLGRVIGGLVTK
ncbi:uncharacterized protein L3040_003458 [Drepanopeziza brunnea f. sp. 'multigermtubi']|uniref:uncharacterized protein n=1 Tax=Drepanopeziza brunnea f. sp. 'multigermtubi' TaxID=698441 RepID=UPI0023A2961D|nr:hypothetical protein L3040_003458 [Drepanopeziza brunnea f. sp. 'multigermtubi']